MSYLDRAIADSRDRENWMRVRADKIGGSDAAKFARVDSAHLYLKSKLDNPFTGNTFTAHGNDRERHMLAHYGFEQNTLMIAAEGNPRHVSTPDGIKVSPMSGEILLAECKTSTKPMPAKTPAGYLRQCFWNLYVLGATKILLIWEQHDGNFRPVSAEPESRIIERDDDAIRTLITISDLVLAGMDDVASLERHHS